jgi:hypothetical protein
MAGLSLNATSGEVALVASTAKTCLQLKAPANQKLKLRTLSLLGKQAAGGTDAPVKVRLTTSSANFGSGSGATVGKLNPGDAETPQGTYTVLGTEPTSPTDSGYLLEFSPQSGLIVPFPPGLEIPIPGGHALNIELTSSATPTVVVTATVEE